MHSVPDLKGRVALITGGGSGFGRAAALEFAERGAKVAIADLDRASAEASAAAVMQAGGEAIAIEADVSDETAVVGMIARSVKAFGRIDCAFNNAGVLGPVGELHEVPLAEFERIMNVNVRGVFLCMQAEIRLMLGQKSPAGGHSIVNTASIAGLFGSPAVSAYCGSKHAVVGLTRAAARSYGKRGIRVNCICPGPVDTPLAGPLFSTEARREALLARQAIDRFVSIEEVAGMAVWLSSPAAAMITGTPMRIDGGVLA